LPVITNFIHIKTNGENDMVNITKETSKAVVESNMVNGVAVVFVTGSTAAITTIEFEPGLKKDFPNMLARIAPKEIEYQHDNTWQDGNGHSHVRASIIGPSITIPFVDGKIMLGMWQQIVILEMDIQPREREIIIQIIGA
jgi:secondary thiamine-phosphate synthase enzyme